MNETIRQSIKENNRYKLHEEILREQWEQGAEVCKLIRDKIEAEELRERIREKEKLRSEIF